MSIRIVVNLTEDSADVISQYGAGAKLYLLSATSEGGSYSDVTSTLIVSGTEQYELTDNAGTSSTWYRSQVGDSTGASRSSLSDAFQATSLAAYATVDDLAATLAIAGANHNALLSDLLIDVSADVDASTMRRFYRDPQVSGTTTVYADVMNPGCRSLEDAIGAARFADGRALDIVSVTTLEVRDSETSSYVEVSAGDAGYLLQAGPAGTGVAGTDWPFEDIVLSPAAPYPFWPVGLRAVRIVGAFGFPRVPSSVRRGVIGEAQERFRQTIGGGPGPSQIATNAFGQPVFLAGDSPAVRRILRHPFSRRPMAA